MRPTPITTLRALLPEPHRRPRKLGMLLGVSPKTVSAWLRWERGAAAGPNARPAPDTAVRMLRALVVIYRAAPVMLTSICWGEASFLSDLNELIGEPLRRSGDRAPGEYRTWTEGPE